MMTTLLVATTPQKVKRGRPRAPREQLKPRGERARRDRAKVLLKELAAAGRDPPPELLELARPRKLGRPRLTNEEITPGARRQRTHYAKKRAQLEAEAHHAEAATSLLCLKGGAGAEAEAAALAAK